MSTCSERKLLTNWKPDRSEMYNRTRVQMSRFRSAVPRACTPLIPCVWMQKVMQRAAKKHADRQRSPIKEPDGEHTAGKIYLHLNKFAFLTPSNVNDNCLTSPAWLALE